MGASIGMAGGELLGTVFEQHTDSLENALTDWEHRLHRYTDNFQDMGAKASGLFTRPARPRSCYAAPSWRPIAHP
jgi:hypothetical protein